MAERRLRAVPEPISAAQRMVAIATDAGLLHAYAALTHRMHAAKIKKDPFKENDLRVQRNVLEDAILERMKQGRG